MRNSKKKYVLITGANGFIGRSLCNFFSNNGYQVIALVRSLNTIYDFHVNDNVKVLEWDLLDECELSELYDLQLEALINTAWVGPAGKNRASLEIQNLNVRVLRNLVDFCKKANVHKFINLGTVSQFIVKDIYSIVNVTENMMYAVFKNLVEDLQYLMMKESNTKHVWLYLANVYGPQSNNGNIIESTIKKLLAGETALFTSADYYYDFIFIDDLISAISLLVEAKNLSNRYYIGSGNPRLLKEFLIEVSEVVGNNSKIEFGINKMDGVTYEKSWFNNDKINKDTGFISSWKFSKGIIKTVDYIKGDIDGNHNRKN
jgi:nucleoside-diphosphate-sugar epimerase